MIGLVGALRPIVEQIAQLASQIRGAVRSHPDGPVFLSFFRDPKSTLCAAGPLAEIGDNRARYPTSGECPALRARPTPAAPSNDPGVSSATVVVREPRPHPPPTRQPSLRRCAAGPVLDRRAGVPPPPLPPYPPRAANRTRRTQRPASLKFSRAGPTHLAATPIPRNLQRCARAGDHVVPGAFDGPGGCSPDDRRPVYAEVSTGAELYGRATWINLTSAGGTSYAVPHDGRITSFNVRVARCEAPGRCDMRLLVLRESLPQTYQVIAASEPVAGVAGLNTIETSLDVQEGDLLALEQEYDVVVYVDSQPGATTAAEWALTSTNPVVLGTVILGWVLQFNAQLVDPVATTVTVDAASAPVIGGEVGYRVHVNRVSGSDRSAIAGTVSLSKDGSPIADCQALPVAAGEASCTTTAAGAPGSRSITASYSGDSPFEPSTGTSQIDFKTETTTTLRAGGSGSYIAKVAPAPAAGTVAFSLNGAAIAGCAARPVDAATGEATCVTTAPTSDHTVRAAFSGAAHYLASAGEAAFTVPQAGVLLPATADAGAVKVGKTSAPVRVTLTSSGDAAVTVASAAASGSEFAVAGDTCSGTSVAPGAGCTVEVSFRPAAAGKRTAQLAFSGDAGTHTVALTGTGVAPAAAVFAPWASKVRKAKRSGAFSAPLHCPADETCTVDGTLTISTAAFARYARAAKQARVTIGLLPRMRIAAGKGASAKAKAQAKPRFSG